MHSDLARFSDRVLITRQDLSSLWKGEATETCYKDYRNSKVFLSN